MDNITLDNLIAAYRSAPSPELAKVLLQHFLEAQDFDQASNYIDGLPTQLANNDFLLLAGLCLPHPETVDKLVARCQAEDINAALEGLIERDDIALARRILILLKNRQGASISENLEARLSEQSKLKLVDKNVVDLFESGKTNVPELNFNDVVGLESIKKQIHKKIILPFQKPSLFQKFKKKVGGGVLLYGPPGCGKTLLARATAGECQAQFFNIEITDVLDMYIGESEQKLRAIFEKARSSTPSILFFDELEALAGKREHMRNQASANTVSQFLTELDGFAHANQGVLVLASTNVPWSIDSAFMRPGRFDRMFFVPPPDRQARAAILKHHMKDRPANSDINFDTLAQKTGGYSGADLANLVEMAADEAIEESMIDGTEIPIAQAHFKLAESQARATTSEWLTTARNYARYANDGGRYDDVLDFLKRHGK